MAVVDVISGIPAISEIPPISEIHKKEAIIAKTPIKRIIINQYSFFIHFTILIISLFQL